MRWYASRRRKEETSDNDDTITLHCLYVWDVHYCISASDSVLTKPSHVTI